MDAREIYARLSRLVDEMPDLTVSSTEAMKWMGAVVALVAKTGSAEDRIGFQNLAQLHGMTPYLWANEILPFLHRVLQKLELEFPVEQVSSFILAGSPFDAMAAVGKVFKEAQSDVLVVDPYLDETFLNDFAVILQNGVSIRLLSDASSVKPALKPAVQRRGRQHGANWPIEARNATPRTLHDRLVLIDRSRVWTLTQSFKDLAARSPASIILVAPDIAALKIPAYEAMWGAAAPI